MTTLRRVTVIDGEVRRASPRGYRLTLSAEIDGRSALRSLNAQACAELVEAAVWLLKLAVGPERPPPGNDAPGMSDAQRPTPSDTNARSPGDGPSERRREDARPSAPPERDRASADTRSDGAATQSQVAAEKRVAAETKDGAQVPAAEPTPTRRRAEVHARIAGFGGVFAGGGAKVQAAIGVWASVSADVLHTQLSFADMLPVNESAAGGRHVQIGSLALGVSECALWGQRFHAGPCVELEALRTTAQSKDFGANINRTVFWGALHVGLQFLWPLTRFLELSLSAGAGVPITPRPRFTVQGAGTVAAAQPWSQEARMGLIYVAH